MTAVPAIVRNQKRLAVSLAMTAGYVDGFGLLKFNTFLSFMSGNTTQTGANIGRVAFQLAVPSGVAIVSFLVGVVLGNLVKGARRRDAAVIACVGMTLAAIFVGLRLELISTYTAIAFIALAMGVMNTTQSHVGEEQISLAFVTGTLNKLGRHLALGIKRVPLEDAQGTWDTRLGRVMLLGGVWVAFLCGAILAGFSTPRMADSALLPAAGLLLLVAMIVGSFNRDDARNTPRRA